jgi:hypothetical protein
MSILNAQVPPLEDHIWKLEKIVTSDSTLVVPIDINFNALFQNSIYYKFGNCVFVGGNLSYSNENPNFTINFSSVPFEVCPGEEVLMDIEEFFQEVFFFDVFMVSWHEPFSYTFTTTSDKIFLDITNNEGSVATFYNDFLSQQEFLNQQLKVYPNPVKDKLFLESPGLNIKKTKVYDLHGKVILVNDTLENNSLDLSQLERGIYFLRIETTNAQITKKIIKE